MSTKGEGMLFIPKSELVGSMRGDCSIGKGDKCLRSVLDPN